MGWHGINKKKIEIEQIEKKMMDQDQNRQGQRQEGMQLLPTVGRARRINHWEHMQREEEMRLRMAESGPL